MAFVRLDEVLPVFYSDPQITQELEILVLLTACIQQRRNGTQTFQCALRE